MRFTPLPSLVTHKLTHSVVLSTEQIVLLEEILQQVEEKGIKHQVKIIRLIESALGVRQSEQIASSRKTGIFTRECSLIELNTAS